MRVFDFSSPIPDTARNAIVAVGNFDGVHKGHRLLLNLVKDEARKRQVQSAVLTFEPHPRQLFQPDATPFRLTLPQMKLDLLEQAGIDSVFVLPFTPATASLSKDDFMAQILRAQIAPSQIIVGENFHFGHKRAGHAKDLLASGFDTRIAPAFTDDAGQMYSSSRVRDLIRLNDFDAANVVEGWAWYVEGIVQRGDQRGREMGFPTANVPLGATFQLPYGVYATLVQIVDEDGTESPWYNAATNIGIRPMFETKNALVEAHILDFSGDLYGKTLRIRPVSKIRDEMKYTGIDALITQITQDCVKIRHVLAVHNAA